MNATHSKPIIAFSTKAEGSMKQKDGKNNITAIKTFLTHKGIASDFVSMQQVHSGKVARVAHEIDIVIPEVDGILTDKRNLSLCIVTADCLPILFYDPHRKVIAAIHAGRKGLLADIVHAVIVKMRREFAVKQENILVTIGPSIEMRCYEVGKEVIEDFTKQYSWFDTSYYKEATHGKFFLDLRKIALHSLIKERILESNISVVDVCTKCSTDTYYSYRNGDTTGRFVSAICMI